MEIQNTFWAELEIEADSQVDAGEHAALDDLDVLPIVPQVLVPEDEDLVRHQGLALEVLPLHAGAQAVGEELGDTAVHQLPSELPHLLVDLVAALDELLFDEDDVLLLQQGLDLGQAHAGILHIADDVQPGGLADVVVAVAGALLP